MFVQAHASRDLHTSVLVHDISLYLLQNVKSVQRVFAALPTTCHLLKRFQQQQHVLLFMVLNRTYHCEHDHLKFHINNMMVLCKIKSVPLSYSAVIAHQHVTASSAF